MLKPFVVLCGLLLAALAAAPLSALDFDRPVRHRFDLFDPLPVKKIEDAARPARPDEPEPEAEPEPTPTPDREPQPTPRGGRLDFANWFSRGVSVGLVGTASFVFPGAGIGLEVTVPVQREISGLLRAGMIGSIFFEGGYYDIGARGYFDTSEKFTLYTTVGLRMTYGRILDYAGGTLNHPIHRFGMGGFAEGGLEYGSRRVRFFAEFSINGVRTFDTDFQIGFFCGVNFGIRFYIG